MAHPMICPRCGNDGITGFGFRRSGSILSPRGRVQRYVCRKCSKKFHPSLKAQPLVLKEGYLDIEAMGLKANFDPIIAWSILSRDTDKITCDLIPRWNMGAEKEIVRSLVKEMDKYDRLITYNGTMYDIPFIRTRALRHGLKFPEYMALYHHDLYFVARGRLSAHRKNLGTVARVLGVIDKLELDPRDWEAAQFGDRAALKRILEHNKQDVRVLKAVHEVLEPFYQGTNRSI
jgi:uncharacterized protein YprB with RNaseH-like and TPR domain